MKQKCALNHDPRTVGFPQKIRIFSCFLPCKIAYQTSETFSAVFAGIRCRQTHLAIHKLLISHYEVLNSFEKSSKCRPRKTFFSFQVRQNSYLQATIGKYQGNLIIRRLENIYMDLYQYSILFLPSYRKQTHQNLI